MAAFKPKLSILIPDDEPIEHRTLASDIEHYNFDIDSEKEELIDIQQKTIDASKKSPLNTKLSYISFKESQVRHDNILKTFVYGIRYGEDKWIKIYKTDIDFKTIIESEFVFEVYYQKKAHELNESCGFISPAVIDYGAFIDEYYVYHYMIMDYIPETKLQKDECDAIKEKVGIVDKCLRDNGIFHNDLAARNVFSRDSEPNYNRFWAGAEQRKRRTFFSGMR